MIRRFLIIGKRTRRRRVLHPSLSRRKRANICELLSQKIEKKNQNRKDNPESP
jgi:hypothetical protein